MLFDLTNVHSLIRVVLEHSANEIFELIIVVAFLFVSGMSLPKGINFISENQFIIRIFNYLILLIF